VAFSKKKTVKIYSFSTLSRILSIFIGFLAVNCGNLTTLPLNCYHQEGEWAFFITPSKPIAYTSFLRPTDFSRINGFFQILLPLVADLWYYFGLYSVVNGLQEVVLSITE